eukprot:5658355-Prymnesium_polylepis.2
MAITVLAQQERMSKTYSCNPGAWRPWHGFTGHTDFLVNGQCARSSDVSRPHSEVAFGGGKRHHRTPAGQ